MSTYKDIAIDEILFLDIETVPEYENYHQLNPLFKKLWDKKASTLIKNEDDTPETLYHRAGIYSEFGKIICISVGFYDKNKQLFRVKSFWSEFENELLENFFSMLNSQSARQRFKYFCGHNIKEFDLPYICRRAIINNLPLPVQFDFQGKKPWETNLLDTMDMWRFGDVKNFTSLELLTTVLELDSSKSDIDGSQVFSVYYEQGDIERIVEYCQNDVIAVARVFMKLRGDVPFSTEAVMIVE